ncbi:MAG: OmpH family outer membrane protein [Aquificae bacterium]|nr:OmpH family outer membrane protein [Aquificota bacterium]
MFKFILSVILVILSYSFSFAGKIAFIDMQKVLNESVAGKEIQNTLNKKVEKLKKEIERKQAAGESQQALQKFMMEKQRELNKLRQQLADKFMKVLESAIKDFSKRYGYDLILDKTPIIYGNKSLNKTAEFLNFFNNYYKRHK